jgi:Zn finger protein HypA/HybF involved in hydrogenase expression
MYESSQLRWVKNVKRNRGTGWAYTGFNVGDSFYLHFPEHFKGNVLVAPVGDLILIFQTVNSPKGTYLTHIVTPLDNIRVEDRASTHPYKRMVGVVAVADPISSIPKPSDLDFKQPNRGACCHLYTIKDIRTKDTINEGTLQQRLWGLFQNRNAALDETFRSILSNDIDDDEGVEEGAYRTAYRLHKYYERNSAVVKRKKEIAQQQGTLFCEVCGFNFIVRYPQVGTGFIECHHKTPIHNGLIRTTTVNDLALVCSNCHRMLHRLVKGKYLTVEKLSQIYNRE